MLAVKRSTLATARIPVIDALRGVAALAVVLFHLSQKLTSSLGAFFEKLGHLGVDVFFVISGFVVWLSLYEHGYRLRDFPAFFLRRMVRLEPPYIFSIVLAIALWHLSVSIPGHSAPSPNYTWPSVLSHFFYLTPLTGNVWLNPVYWTLAWEFVFYITVGATFALISVRHVGWTVAACVLICIVGGTVDAGIGRFPAEFTAGVLVARIMTGAGVMVAWLLVPIALIWWQGEALAGVVCLLTCITILWGRNLKPWPAVIWLGTISYSLYLVHFDVGRRIVAIGSSFTKGVMAYDALLLLVGTLASAIAAWAVWRFIELPAQRASRTFAFGAKKPGRVASATTVESLGHEK